MLDLGSGAGTDSLVAAQMVGQDGHVTGVDMTPEMLAKARAAASEIGAENVEFVESEVEKLPFIDGSFDIVISNGVIDLKRQYAGGRTTHCCGEATNQVAGEVIRRLRERSFLPLGTALGGDAAYARSTWRGRA